MSSVKVLADVVVKCSKEKESSENTRELEDEVDDYKQKNLAGKFVITCDRKKPSEMKTQEELAADGGERALPAHIVQLALAKYAGPSGTTTVTIAIITISIRTTVTSSTISTTKATSTAATNSTTTINSNITTARNATTM